MDEQQQYSGSPIEVGAALATDALHPTIMQTIQDGATGQQLVGMLTGMILFVAGTASLTVSHAEAVQMMKRCLEYLEKIPPQAPQEH